MIASEQVMSLRFQWQLPNPPPDPDALERMRQNFPLPRDPMPEAWFISGEVNFFTWLYKYTPAELLKNRQLRETVFRELAGGLTSFPKVPYVKDWKAWFRYLIADAILYAGPYEILGPILNAFFAVYPDGIVEEYPGFRQDVVYSLGTRFIPEKLSRDQPPNPNFQHVENIVLNDLWDKTGYSYTGMEYPGVGDEPGLAMFFCLKYLTPAEIETWIESIFNIKRPQWYLTIITWWLAFRQFLTLVEIWPQDGKLTEYFKATGLAKYVSPQYRSFKSFDDFIPKNNLVTFNVELSRYLTLDVFEAWSAEIRSHRTLIVDGDEFPLDEGTIGSIESILADFELKFFYGLA